MSATAHTPTQRDLIEAVSGEDGKNEKSEDSIYERIWMAWGFRKQDYGDRMLIPLSSKMKQGGNPDPRQPLKRGTTDQYREKLNRWAGGEGAVLGAGGVTAGYEEGKNSAVDAVVAKDGPIDRNVVEQATPIAFDPRIVDIQRRQATILDRISQQGQAGFAAKYNVVSDRADPIGFLSESGALDLSDEKDSDHTLGTDEKDMKIFVDKTNISDFTARAEASLGYMDVTQMTMGQRVIAHALAKAQTFFYGDPSVGATNNGVFDPEVSESYAGMAKMAVDGGTNADKSGISMTGDQPVLKDIKSELTKLVQETGLTYANAEIAVSPTMYDYIENETNISTRIDAFDEAVTFGGRAMNIKGNTPLIECPNIRDYPDQSTSNFTPDSRDVFIYDRTTVQFRSLMPLTTVPLARVGLGNRAALAEFGTLIDKSQGAHLAYLSNYAQ
ncbi:hypothetical protein [Halococcus sp. PRR34]|uniref:hypothetical protein n=1 Tax=Halococcus sp. PRR34 TaxID=3020830 RepID=UPI00235F8927|nr:hypothetical protein [Halococcus sp. PRR34]